MRAAVTQSRRRLHDRTDGVLSVLRWDHSGKNGGQAIWKRFLRDCQAASFILVSSSYELEEEILEIAERHKLDIDDAHQYEAARRLDADLVSFDRDFDRTDIQRKEPRDFL